MKPYIVSIRTTRQVEVDAEDADSASQQVRDFEAAACKDLGTKKDQAIRVVPKPSQRVTDRMNERSVEIQQTTAPAPLDS